MHKKVSLSVVLILFIFLLFFPFEASASPTRETVSISSGEIELFAGVKVKITYDLLAQLYPASRSIEPSETVTWHAQVGSGTIRVSVFIPSPINQWYSTSKTLSEFTNNLDIPITSGLSASLKVNPLVSLDIDGPARLSTTSLPFDYEETMKTFTITAHSTASDGSRVTVHADFRLDVSVGLDINLFLFKRQITSMSLGQLPMSPRVSDNVTVSIPFLDRLFDFLTNPRFLIIALPTLAFFIAIPLAIRAKRRAVRQQTTKPIPRRSEPQKTTILAICPKCKTRVPSESKFCPECGTNLQPKRT